MKTSTITKVDWSGDWKAPNGDIIQFHKIQLKNGDTGDIGVKEKYDSKIAIGAEVTYEQNGKRIKLENTNSAPATNNKSTWKGKSMKKPEDYLGYCTAYAKDLVVAGKATAKDLKAYKNAAEQIYEHLKTLLNESNDD